MYKFSHLHTHSHYSLLNALPKIKDLVARAKKCGMPALALTDNGNMYGAIEFYEECLRQNIKPIIGVDFYVALKTRFDNRPGIDNRSTRLILLAKNETGYKNLIRLVTKSHLEGFYYKPRIDKELLEKYGQGLICIMPQFSGEISKALQTNDFEKAKEIADWYKNNFKNFYLEITHHPEIAGQLDLKKKIIDFAKRENLDLVAAQDVYYLNPADKKARDILMSIQGTYGKYKNEQDDFSFIDQQTANGYFKETPSALENVEKIIDSCYLELTLGEWVFPRLEIPAQTTYDSELRRLAFAGIEKRGLQKTPEIAERLEYELKIIKDKGYSVYFLIVADLLNFAHTNNIYTNIRGSVAGSMITYLTKITAINPIDYKIPFERFLNPERPSAPDIDMDFADNRRDEVIQYAREKYGGDKVAQIGTFGSMMARGAVRDTARALGYDYAVGDKIAKLIPMGSQGFPMTIARALEMEPDLAKLYKQEKDARTVIDFAQKIEGCARHISVHAAGVVIAPKPLSEYTPLQHDPKGKKIITQYDMHSVEKAGLIKFDFLGIKNLSILANAVRLVKKIQDLEIDIDKIPLDDKKTYAMLTRGETHGTFQLNGSGMTKWLMELRPTTIHDINAMVALYRPGAMNFIPDYIARKRNPNLIKYIDPRVEEFLKDSLGLMVYQDDVMMIAIKLAGYSWLEADKFRKAMGKKIPELMQEQENKFKRGCLENKMDKKVVEKLWTDIEKFAAYGFNKAHAASYGRVAYQTSYLKANYPVEYITALLTADSGEIEKIAETVAECKRMKIPVLPPDINESFSFFTITPDHNIRFGLCTIKNFGEGIAQIIISERKKNGKFKSLTDFFTRIKDRNLNKKSFEALVKCGALDAFGERGQMLANTEDLLKFNKEESEKSENQNSLFELAGSEASVSEIKLKNAPPATTEEKLAWEKELLGLYISGHPLEKFRRQLQNSKTDIEKIKQEFQENTTTVVAGIIEENKPILTRRGDKMAFVRLSDFSGSIEAVVFPKILEEYKNLLEVDKCVLMKGRISKRNGDLSLIVEAVKELK
ncbi:MAG: DNA polymerase III subunit alpha [Candidatus Pacebacteria bacterium]|nr:DNA polymerase III subunit alpha [Candidatus Paceibacterota bacterium]